MRCAIGWQRTRMVGGRNRHNLVRRYRYGTSAAYAPHVAVARSGCLLRSHAATALDINSFINENKLCTKFDTI